MSLNRGEVLISGLLAVVAGELWWGGQRWWWKDERDRAKINHDGSDGGLKLRSPLKITFDMNACASDSKIKTCIILRILVKYKSSNFRNKYAELRI